MPKKELSDSTLSSNIYFHQGYSSYDPNFSNNQQTLNLFVRSLNELRKNPYVELTDITITSGASPEGSVALNQRLSDRRGARVRSLISKQIPWADSLIVIDSRCVDYEQLAKLVENSETPFKTEVLTILRNGPPDRIKQQLISLHGGGPWRYMYKNLFPAMRVGSALVCHYRISLTPLRNTDGSPVDSLSRIPETKDSLLLSLSPNIPATAELDSLHNSISSHYPPQFAYSIDFEPLTHYSVKTNLLYNALTIPNLGADLYLGRNISLSAAWQYAWWSLDSRHIYWRAYGGDLAARYWFNSNKRPDYQPFDFTGHHLGLYASLFTYDFELGGRGYMGGLPKGTLWDRAHFAAGIEYGYSKPIGKDFNLDFAIGLGYTQGEVREYIPTKNGYLWQKTLMRRFWGPTKAEISLVWLPFKYFERKRAMRASNKKKGGVE